MLIKNLIPICKKIEVEKWDFSEVKDSNKAAHRLNDEVQNLFYTDKILPSSSISKIPKQWEIYIDYIDLAISHYIDTSLLASERRIQNQRLIWPEENLDGPHPNVVLEVLFINLSNTLISIKKLILLSLDSQARILFRWFVELVDLTIAVISDPAIYKRYIQKIKDDDVSKHWNKYLKPQIIRNCNERIDLSLGLDKDIVDQLLDFRKATYSWLSGFGHANWAAQAVSAFETHLEEPDIYKPSYGGALSKKSESTLMKVAEYIFVFSNYSFFLLVHKHGWKKLSDDKQRLWWCYRSEILKNYLLNYYSDMLEQDK